MRVYFPTRFLWQNMKTVLTGSSSPSVSATTAAKANGDLVAVRSPAIFSSVQMERRNQ